MFPHSVFVLHSPYPDGTWRGLEKCLETDQGDESPRLFQSRKLAEDFLSKRRLKDFQIVEVTLVTPSVRAALDEATQEKLDNLLPR